ncbi:hypothetical protein D9Q98_002143 [Chlorella vulgaris]|uniref:Mid2 domain-containing protein n=1 Tax=Chlorella vulgaris TaxID=3077 RepID=A0A9D4TW99_CHLVU|nr:hypothetical protein D9Q98_002143 [Chlorella vulgaris]
MRTSSVSTGMLLTLLLCASAPCARAAGRTLTQSYSMCKDYTDQYDLIDTQEFAGDGIRPPDLNIYFMGQNVGEFFVVASAQLGVGPSPPTDSSDSSSSGTSIGVIVGAAVGGVVLLAVLGGLIFWCYRRRQRRARSNAEHDLGIGDFVMDKAVEHVTKEEEASSETSDVAVEF